MEQDQTSGKPLREMTIAVVGCGSIGKRHIRNLFAIGAGKVIACDIDEKKRGDVGHEFSIDVFPDIQDALLHNSCDAAFICSPPRFHIDQARELLSNNVHCFIEKPLSDNLAGIDEIINIAEKNKKIALVGYNIRYSSYFRKIKEMVERGWIGKILYLKASIGYYLPYWRPNEDYRQGYGSKKRLGGGIILDASHEIDYILHLLGDADEIFAVCGKLSNLEIDTEDFAEITIRFKNGAFAQIHLDYLQSNYRRSCEIIGETGMLLWDINDRIIRHYSLEDKEYHVYYEGLSADTNDMYLEEMKHFFSCIDGVELPKVDLREGKRVQQIISKIKESSESGQYLKV